MLFFVFHLNRITKLQDKHLKYKFDKNSLATSSNFYSFVYLSIYSFIYYYFIVVKTDFFENSIFIYKIQELMDEKLKMLPSKYTFI